MLLKVFLIIVLIQAFFFGLAARRKTDVFTDISYGGTFVLIALWLFYGASSFTLVQGVVSFLVVLRGVRIAGYLFLRILTIKKDHRFDGMREKPKEFVKFRTLQAITIFIVGLAAWTLLVDTGPHTINIRVVLGVIVFGIGFYLETKADRQKFKQKRQYPKQFVHTGLWAKARHPNYFGEMLIRWGIFFVAVSQFSGWQLLTVISPVFITYLLLFVSGIPPLEKQHDAKYGDDPAYQKWKAETNMLIPW